MNTSVGPVQFGIPPETIKDSMRLALPVPTYFVVFGPMFDTTSCLNMAEFEFPTYFNFFIKKQKVTLIVEESTARRMTSIFRETLLGPEDISTLDVDYPRSAPPSARPNFIVEGRDLGDPRYKEQPLQVSDLIDYVIFDEDFQARLGESVRIRVNPVTNIFTVFDGDVKLCDFPVSLQSNRTQMPVNEGLISTLFVPPDFGVTFVGTSHGFDPNGRTSGFVLWIGKRGIIVDPPPYTGHVLTAMGIAPRLIDTIVLSHCHADHDAGSFQKILRSSNVRIITTTTIMESFVRKYAAISNFEAGFIQRLFRFMPCKIGVPLALHGGELTFQYSLHTIPCVSFTAAFAGKRIVFSGDTCYDPELLNDMYKRRAIGKARLAQLMNFDWEADMIIHEAGVPPIHTPLSVLQALPDSVKRRLYVVHSASAAVAAGEGLTRAMEGQTVSLDVGEVSDIKSEVVDLFSHINIFKELIVDTKAIRRLLDCVTARAFKQDDVIFREGDPPDAVYVVMSGVVRERKAIGQYIVGDFFGELAVVMDQARHAEFFCQTDCELIVIERSHFLTLIANTGIRASLERIFRNVVDHHVRKVLAQHSLFSQLPSCLQVQVEAIMYHRKVSAGERLWARGRPVEFAYFVLSGSLECSFPGSSRAPFVACEGTFLCDTDAIIGETAATSTLLATEDSTVMALAAAAVAELFAAVPGLLVFTMRRLHSN